MKVGVALGSNLDDRLQNLRAARQAIAELPGISSPLSSSSIYETEPVDCELDYQGDPITHWRGLKKIESSLGRPPNHERNVSRNIDIDLLYFGDVKIDSGELVLPHPRMHLRRFVLQPLAEIDPDLVLPNQTKTVRELLASLHESAKVVRFTNDW